MADRRMISKKIVDTDLFLEMPMSSRLLYYDLLIRADDDGFVGSPKKITGMIGASDDDLRILIGKRFIIPFESGICVIKDWRIHNYIKSDRYQPTQYLVEKSQLELTSNKSYEKVGTEMEPEWNQTGTKMDTQVRLGKVRLEIGKSKGHMSGAINVPAPSPVISLTLNDKSEYPITQNQIDEWLQLYPAIDILQELRKMKGWIDSNPSRRKTSRGILRFINAWLSREQDRGGSKPQPSKQPLDISSPDSYKDIDQGGEPDWMK